MSYQTLARWNARHRRFAPGTGLVALPLLALALPAGRVAAQDSNILLPIASIEQRLSKDSLQVINIVGSRKPDDRTSRATVVYNDSAALIVKFAPAPVGGHTFNNAPRYEVAAYEIQKLFLTEPDYVVPPTVLRSFDLEWYRQLNASVTPTFGKTKSVIAVLQYWLSNITPTGVYDPKRLDIDTVYARHFANLNILTHLIKHNDANVGNVLMSTYQLNPRLFTVDNGVAFGLEESDRGTEWRELRTSKLPAYTVEKLRAITRADLDRTLEVIAEYEIRDERLVPVEKTPNLGRGQGVRQKDGHVQFGLTKIEIDGIERRLKALLDRVDKGKLKTF